VPTQVLVSGPRAVLRVKEDRSGRVPSWDFVKDELSEKERIITIRLLEFIAEHGPPRNTQKFKKITGTVFYEIKPTKQVRLVCFILKGVTPLTLLILGACKKKSRKLADSVIQQAKAELSEFLGQGSIL
jgi:hypothetical protein